MFNKKITTTIIGAALMIGAHTASAGSTSAGSIVVNLNLTSSCIATTYGSSFGTYTTSTPNLTNLYAGTIEVTCPPGQPYRIMVDGGMYGDGMSSRRMIETNTYSGTVAYELYDINKNIVGDANPLSAYTPVYQPYSMYGGIDGTGMGSPYYHDLYADVYLETSTLDGYYTDAVGVTVTF